MASFTPAAPAATGTHTPAAGHQVALTSLMVLFFMMGFITSLNDILIPYWKEAFSLTHFQSSLVQLAFFMTYGLFSFPASIMVTRLGYRRGMIVGFLIAAAGALLFFPAYGANRYEFYLGALFVLAAGIVVLQVVANPYVTVLGPPRTSSARLTLAQAFNSIGTTIAPVLGALLILQYLGKKENIGPDISLNLPLFYTSIAIVLALIAFTVSRIRLPEIQESTEEANFGELLPDRGSALGYRHLVLGALGIFCYVGAEVAIGSFAVSYLQQDSVRGPLFSAGEYVAFYWGGAMVGRFAASVILRLFNPGMVLALNATVAALLVVAAMSLSGVTAQWLYLSIGLFNSLMFPTIFTLAVKGIGRHTKQASGIISTAIVGGALIPALQGLIIDEGGMRISYLLPLVCYLYILFYGLWGHRPADKPLAYGGAATS